MDQIFPYKYQDSNGDFVKETQVYSGPSGEGSFDIEYKTEVVPDSNGDRTVLYKKCTHTGPEARESYDWTEIDQNPVVIEGTITIFEGQSIEEQRVVQSSSADPIILVLTDECDWLANVGLQLSDSYKAAKIAELEGGV